MSVYHNMMTDDQKMEGLKASHAILSKKSLCETCRRANENCPIWEPGKYVEECVEHRMMKAPNAEVSEGGTRDFRIETAAQSRPSLH